MLDIKKIEEESVWVKFPITQRPNEYLYDVIRGIEINDGIMEAEPHILRAIQKIKTEKESGEKFKIRFVTDERVRMEYAREKKKDDDKKDPAGADLTIALAVIACEDWEGITAGGVKFECTEANKKILFSKFYNRAEFIVQNAKNEALFLGGNLEDDLKN